MTPFTTLTSCELMLLLAVIAFGVSFSYHCTLGFLKGFIKGWKKGWEKGGNT